MISVSHAFKIFFLDRLFPQNEGSFQFSKNIKKSKKKNVNDNV